MIAACPKCNARYRVDEARVGADGARLRCAQCQAVFRVRVPGAPAAAAPASAPAPAPVQRAAAPAQPPRAAAPSPAPRAAAPAAARPPAPAPVAPVAEPPAQYDRERLVLIADPQEDAGKGTASALAAWGLQTILVHDGVEAMMAIQRTLPRVVILDAALPKMYGFQVCEVIKRNDSLRDTKVVLVGSIHNRERYRRPPSELYGADVYLEQPDLPDGLHELMVRFGVPMSRGGGPAAPVRARSAAPSAPAPAPARPVAQAPVAPARPAPAPRASAPAPAVPAAGDPLAAEREKAERLARIVVSDIVLYQGDKFDEAIRAGHLLEALDTEIEEGRNFFRQRINEAVRNERDYLIDELMRVARQRGMK